ncbi:hypothetical protein B9G55_14305 [Saccharibacillus sp. O16]|nr:hypothetical protein B9G55_14305 [Saccharibacillus sp. O16]
MRCFFMGKRLHPAHLLQMKSRLIAERVQSKCLPTVEELQKQEGDSGLCIEEKEDCVCPRDVFGRRLMN